MKEKSRKTLIIITSVLLVILVVVGLIMLLSQSSNKEKEKDTKQKEDYRCVEGLCVNKVSVEGENVMVSLKNESTEGIAELCVEVTAKNDKKFELCVNDFNSGDDLSLALPKEEFSGEDVKDFKLAKAKEEEEVIVEQAETTE